MQVTKGSRQKKETGGKTGMPKRRHAPGSAAVVRARSKSQSTAARNLMVISDADVERSALAMPRILACVERALHSTGTNGVHSTPEIGLRPRPRAMLGASLGALGEAGPLGLCWHSDFDGGARGDGTTGASTIFLIEPHDGKPVALLDGTWIATSRIAAVSALFSRECRSGLATTALVVGADGQGRATVPALLAACPDIERLIVYDPRPSAIERLVVDMRETLPYQPIEIATELRSAANDADIVIGPSGRNVDVQVDVNWLRRGALMVLLGQNLDAAMLRRCDRILSTDNGEPRFAALPGDWNALLPAIDASLPGILTGRQQGRLNASDRIVAFNRKLPVAVDLALAQTVYEATLLSGAGSAIRWE